jgi:asparagine synthase (glutamine-hydrolysing)
MGLPVPWALSVVFPGPECNEEAVQRGVAKALGVPQKLLPFETAVDGRWLSVSLEMSAGWPLPLLSAWNAVYYRLAMEAPTLGSRIILTGTGGDEWLGVTPALAADLIRTLDFRGLWDLCEAQQRSFLVPRGVLIQRLLWRFGLRPLLRDLVLSAPGGRLAKRFLSTLRREASNGMPQWLAPDPELRRQLADRASSVEAPKGCRSYYLRDVRAGFDHVLTAWEMEEHFVNARRLGVWFLHPFFDPDLVDFLCRIPPLWLNRGGRSKGLVREWVAHRFPQLGFDRQKKVTVTGFYRSKLLAEGRRAWEALGGPRALAELGVVDRRQADLLLGKILTETPAEAYRIWDMLNIEAWARPRS